MNEIVGFCDGECNNDFKKNYNNLNNPPYVFLIFFYKKGIF
jgi:hypothetical protein